MIGWAVETLVASTALMLLVLAIRNPVRRLVGPQVAYALWLLPAARMALPPLPDEWRLMEQAPIGAAIPQGTLVLFQPVATIPAVPQGWGMADVPAAAVAIWIVGSVLFLLYHMVQHRRFVRRVLASGRGYAVAEGRVRVFETAAAPGPLAFGVWRRYVAFPRDFAERYDPQERGLALAHELTHHARGDLMANWFALAVLACHWFNPVAWRAFRAFRADQEMACDAAVLGRATAKVRHAYATAIVKSAHGGAVSAACHLHTVNELKGRLRMLSKHRTLSRRRSAGGTAALAAIGVAALAVTASGTQAAATIRTSVERATGVELASVEAPTALAARVLQTAAAPVAPSAPVVAPRTPEAPDKPATVIVANKGKVTVTGMREGDVTEGTCGNEEPAGAFLVNRKVGDRTVMVVCTDRIEQLTAAATASASAAQASAAAAAASGAQAAAASIDHTAIARNAMSAALAGLKGTRVTMATNPDLPASARAEALADIDESIAELEAEMADAE